MEEIGLIPVLTAFKETDEMNSDILGRPVSYWVDRYGLPLHLYDGNKIKSNLSAFRQVLGEHCPGGLVRFAAKSLTHPAVLSTVKDEGCGADCASYNEVRCALEAGIDPRDIDLNGNCKEDFLIEEAVGKDMLIVADSIEEFRLVTEIAEKVGKTARVLLRISGYNLENVTAASVFTAGRWTKFGVAVEDVADFVRQLEFKPAVDFMGFHTHIGSQITEVEPYLEVMGQMCQLARMMNESAYRCRVLNIGGGYPVSYLTFKQWNDFLAKVREGILAAGQGDDSKLYVWENRTGGFKTGPDGNLDFSKWVGEKFYSPYPKAEMLKALLTGGINTDNGRMTVKEALKELNNPVLVVEPGRSITEDAGISLCRVGHVRRAARCHNLVTLEMGVMDHCDALVEPGVKNWRVYGGNPGHGEKAFETFIGGNLCFSGDMISRYKAVLNKKPERGDVVAAFDTGAYCSWFMSSNTNSFPRPSRVLIKGEKETLMKTRDTYQQIFS